MDSMKNNWILWGFWIKATKQPKYNFSFEILTFVSQKRAKIAFDVSFIHLKYWGQLYSVSKHFLNTEM